MSDLYLWIKWLHILSSTVLFGTGLGTAFHMLAAYRRGPAAAVATVTRNVVLADWLFTTTAGIAQPVTGFTLVWLGGHDPLAGWLVLTYALYVVAALCWFRVVWLQLRLSALAAAAAGGAALPPEFHRCMREWFVLGWPAFIGLVIVFALMVMKPPLF